MEHFINAVKQYTKFDGRSTRTEFWMYVLFYVIFYRFDLIENHLNKKQSEQQEVEKIADNIKETEK